MCYGFTTANTDLGLERRDARSTSPKIVGLRPRCLVVERVVVVERRKHRGYRDGSVASNHTTEVPRLDFGFLTGMWYVWQ